MGNIKAMSEACKWAQLFACMPWSANCPGPLLNGMTLNWWLDGLEGVKVEELIYPGNQGCSDIFVMKKNICIKETPPFECPCLWEVDLNLEASVAICSKIPLTKEFAMAMALLEIPVSGCACLSIL